MGESEKSEVADSAQADDACPVVLGSPYRMKDPNEPICLYSGPLEVCAGGTTVTGEGQISKEWVPRSRITFRISEPDQSIFSLIGALHGHAELRIPSLGAQGKALATQVGQGVNGVLNGRLKIGSGTALRRLSFNLTNFAPVFGKPVRSDDGMGSWVGRLEWRSEKWRIRIDPLPGSHDLFDRLKAVGGFAITHIGQIERSDGSPFTSDEVEETLQIVRHTLSFAGGRWVSPILIDGFGEDGIKRYQEWSSAIISEWNYIQTWFSDLLGEELEDLFKGFQLCWTDSTWRDALRRAIWWYVASNENTGGMDGSLILVQVALELLAWVVYVEHGKIVSKKGFEDLPAADKLRLLLQWMQVRPDIPLELARLSAFAEAKKSPIGPWVFTDIRNSLVHPKNRTFTERQDGVLYEARQLGMWYLELSILFACRYKGKYLNRCKVKAVWESDPVPWATRC